MAIIGSSWEFAKKQPVLLQVWLWLVVLPLIGFSALEHFMDKDSGFDAQRVAIFVLAFLVLIVIQIWGYAAALMIGKRILQSKAGRSRTSFKAVSMQAQGSIIPIILTGILRTGMIILWGLLALIPLIVLALITSFLDIDAVTFWENLFGGIKALIVLVMLTLLIPSIVYSIRSTFFGVAIVAEGLGYRDALRRSVKTVKGRTWTVFRHLVVYGLILFLPISMITAILDSTTKDSVLELIILILSIAATAAASIVYNLCIINLYRELTSTSPATN